jgi:hypothetical protein
LGKALATLVAANIVAIKNVKIDFPAGEVQTDAGAIARRQHDMACRLHTREAAHALARALWNP